MRRFPSPTTSLAGLIILILSAWLIGPAAWGGGNNKTIPGGPGLIAFQDRIVTSGPTLFPIMVMNPDGTGLTTLTTPNKGGYVAWSPVFADGSLKLGWTDQDPRTGNRVVAAANVVRGPTGISLGPISYIPVPVGDLPSDGAIESMDWGVPVMQADGSSQVIPICYSVGGTFDGVYRIFIRVVSLMYAGGQFQVGGSFDFNPGPGYSYENGRFSPDGRWLVLARSYPLNGSIHYGILLIDLTTLTSKVLIDDPVSNNLAPAWSPDGARLAFSSDRSKIWQIYTATLNMDLTVGQVTQMTSSRASGKGWPSWSPDGAQITYGLSSTSTFRIGKTTGNLVEYSLADGGWPDWSPNLP
jgi:hypothetical protein